MTFNISIPKEDGIENLTVEPGSSVLIVGANGSGKTRLASYIEEMLGESAHRIAAHRALSLNPAVSKISEKQARVALKTGWSDLRSSLSQRKSSRWDNKAPVALLNDFDYLLQALFAEQTNRSLETHKKVRAGDCSEAIATKFEILTSVWQRLLPHRELYVTGDNIEVSIKGASECYSASEMSDGERAIFYMLGQSLVADQKSLLIFDEPELHVHKSIMSKLWDELEAIRPDCAFLFITHDLDFACSRVATKYVITSYEPTPSWDISFIPNDSSFDESLVTLILGSRKPILFVEGGNSSLDLATYRCCYPEWTVVPRGSCEQVIHSVVTMRQNSTLTRITCSGIVDADDYSESDIEYLRGLGVESLPVSEIENIFLLPSIAQAILKSEGFTGSELEDKFQTYQQAVFSSLKDSQIDAAIIRYCRRRIDRALKKVDLSNANSVEMLNDLLKKEVSILNIEEIGSYAKEKINTAIAKNDLTLLLKSFDNKGLMALAATQLKNCRLADFEQWLVRILNSQNQNFITSEIKNLLPTIEAR